MEKQESAVEWLIQEHFGGIENCTPYFRKHIKQAIEMEKEQKGYSEIDLEVAFFEGSIHNLTFNQWLEQFKNQKNNL